MTFSLLPDESEERYFARVVVPWVGSRLLTVSFGINESQDSMLRTLLDGASEEGFDVEFDRNDQPEFLIVRLPARYGTLLKAEQTARLICIESGYSYVCRTYFIERGADDPTKNDH